MNGIMPMHVYKFNLECEAYKHKFLTFNRFKDVSAIASKVYDSDKQSVQYLDFLMGWNDAITYFRDHGEIEYNKFRIEYDKWCE